MRLTALVAFVAVVHIGSASMAAQQPTDRLPPEASPFGNLFAPKSKPSSPPRYLFPTPSPKLGQAPGAQASSQPAIVCGMTLIPGDPNVDPGIRHEVPEGGPRFVIRSVEPKVCRLP